ASELRMTVIRLHPAPHESGGAPRTGAFTDAGSSLPPEGDIQGGRPTVPDRRPGDEQPLHATPTDDMPAYAASPEHEAVQQRASRSLLASAVSQTLSRWGARVGLV